MADVQSRLSSKGQTVIPKAVRDKLGLKTGDLIRFRVTEAGAVTLAKVKPQEDDPFATFGEWTSDEDEKLYGRLFQSRSTTEQDYCFRVPLRRSGRTTIQIDQPSIQLFSEMPEVNVTLRSASPKGASLKDAKRWELIGEGYPSEIAASAAGKRLRDGLLLALARIRVGVSTGERGPSGFFTEHGLRWIEGSTGRPAVNEVPGVTVYREPRPLFVSMQAGGVRGVSLDSFREAFEESVKHSRELGLRQQISLFLYNASFFQPGEEARLLLLIMSIEALLDPAPRSAEAQSQIEEFSAKLKRSQLPRAECASLVGTLRWLKRESISQAGQRIAREKLPDKTYLDLSADKFFVHAYDLRSRLAHGNLEFPGFDEVSKLVGALELFAADLITAS